MGKEMAKEEQPPNESPYGTMQMPIKQLKDHKNIGFTVIKTIEADTVLIVYISWPVFSILDIVIILDRLFNYKREAHVLVFEVTACILGYITHLLCAIFLMYMLNLEKKVTYDATGTVMDPKFMRHVYPAVVSTTVACFYLLDCLLSADALLEHWGIQTWSLPPVPNVQVDLEPSTPLRMVLPWETDLGKLSLLNKISQIRNSKATDQDKSED